MNESTRLAHNMRTTAAKWGQVSAQIALLAFCCLSGDVLGQPGPPPLPTSTNSQPSALNLLPSGLFDRGNQLYDAGKFNEAIAAFQGVVRSGRTSPAVWFNLGNAWFKAGQLGHAIAAYRQAEQLAPRDPDLRANLKFARAQVQGPTLIPGWSQRLLGRLSLNEWTWVAVVSVWVWFG